MFKKFIYIIYFVALSQAFMPVADLFAMAYDVVNPTFQTVSYNSGNTCFSPMTMQIHDSAEMNIKTVFSAYGSAARGSVCNL